MFTLVRPLRIAASAALFALVAGPANAEAPASASASGGAPLTGPAIGSPAPAFSLPTIAGKRVSLDDYRGKTLVINVWATWCPPCRAEMPQLIGSAESFAKNGVAFLGVDSTETAPIVRAYAVSKGITYPQAIDEEQSFAKAYDISYFPTTIVIGPDGVLRARYIDEITVAQLTAFTDAAKNGKNAEITSALQTKIDATLNDPALAFTGDAKADIAAARAAQKAIESAEDSLDSSDAAAGNPTDLLRTRSEEAALRDKAIAALAPVVSSSDDRALLALLRGDAARDREAYDDALAAYREAATLAPSESAAFEGIAFSANRLKRYGDAVDADRKLVALAPKHVDPYVDLGIAQGKAAQYDDAYRSFATAVDLASNALAAKPNDPSALRKLAWVHLYFGRTYAKGGDTAHARAEFAQTLALATKLPPRDIRHDMYVEEAQEATVALDLGAPGPTTVSLAPWTGAELPGSVPNTFKYRLVVAGSGGKNVALRAADVPKGWVASFCTDRICAPFRVSVDLPASGVKVIEFQLVPPGSHDKPRAVRVIESDGRHTASATTS